MTIKSNTELEEIKEPKSQLISTKAFNYSIIIGQVAALFSAVGTNNSSTVQWIIVALVTQMIVIIFSVADHLGNSYNIVKTDKKQNITKSILVDGVVYDKFEYVKIDGSSDKGITYVKNDTIHLIKVKDVTFIGKD